MKPFCNLRSMDDQAPYVLSEKYKRAGVMAVPKNTIYFDNLEKKRLNKKRKLEIERSEGSSKKIKSLSSPIDESSIKNEKDNENAIAIKKMEDLQNMGLSFLINLFLSDFFLSRQFVSDWRTKLRSNMDNFKYKNGSIFLTLSSIKTLNIKPCFNIDLENFLCFILFSPIIIKIDPNCFTLFGPINYNLYVDKDGYSKFPLDKVHQRSVVNNISLKSNERNMEIFSVILKDAHKNTYINYDKLNPSCSAALAILANMTKNRDYTCELSYVSKFKRFLCNSIIDEFLIDLKSLLLITLLYHLYNIFHSCPVIKEVLSNEIFELDHGSLSIHIYNVLNHDDNYKNLDLNIIFEINNTEIYDKYMSRTCDVVFDKLMHNIDNLILSKFNLTILNFVNTFKSAMLKSQIIFFDELVSFDKNDIHNFNDLCEHIQRTFSTQWTW